MKSKDKILGLMVVILFVVTPWVSKPASAAMIYWGDSGTDKVQRANLDGSNVEDLVTTGLNEPRGIAVDLSGGKMYWIDMGTDKIQRANLDGSNIEDLVTALDQPWDIALDLSAGKMYWTDISTDKIQRANLDGSNIEDLVTGTNSPYGIALDLTNGKMYWTGDDAYSIRRANLDGSNIEGLLTGLTHPYYMALDLTNGKIYWTDFTTEKIQRANLDGSNVEDLITAGLSGPLGIVLDLPGGKMYWTDWNDSKIQRANLDGGSVEDVVTAGLSQPAGITTSHQQVAYDLQVRPIDKFASSGNEGGPFYPNSKTYTLTNNGPNSLDWTVTATEPWLDVSPGSGTLNPADSNTVAVSINANANTLPTGTHTDTITFTNTVSGIIQTRGVTLQVRLAGMIFYDEFPTTTLDPGTWNVCGGLPTIDDVGINEPSPPYSLRLNGDPGGGDCVESQQLNLSGMAGLELRYWYQRTGGGEHPDSGEDLIIECWDGSTWVELDRQLGDGVDMTDYSEVVLTLPSAAYNADFKLRISNIATAGNYDDWFVDDISIIILDDLSVSPMEDFNSSGYEGGPFTPSNIIYTLANNGTSPLSWTASATQPWLDVVPGAGILNPSDFNTVEVSFNADTNTLPPGDYDDAVTFTNVTSGFVQRRDVVLEVIMIPGEIEVTDSIPPVNDLNMPFGDVFMGLPRTEKITITNTNPNYSLIITDISLGLAGEYFEDFEDGLAQDWQPRILSHWDVVSGEYRADTTMSLNMESVYTGQIWGDCSTQAVMRRTGDMGSAARLVVRATDDFSREDYVGSAYMIAISGGESYHVGKLVNGSFSFIQGWTYSPYLNDGEAANVVMVNIEGSAIEVYFNDNLAWAGTDSSITEAGRIGLMGYNSSGGTTHYFDDVLVTEPETTSQTISAEQQWYNEHPCEDGSLDAAPENCEPPKYPGEFEVLSQATTAVTLKSTEGFLLENVPAVPVVIPPLGSITFDAVFGPEEIKEYESSVRIASNDDDEPELEVQLTGSGILDYLEIIPDANLDFSGHPGGPFVPTYNQYHLINIGPIEIEWQVEVNEPWLDVSPVNGTLQSSESTTLQLSVNQNADLLPEGDHYANLMFTNTTTTVMQNRSVLLNVYTEPKIWIDPRSFDVNLAQGETLTRILTIANGGGSPLDFSCSSRQTDFTPPLQHQAASAVTQLESSEDKIVLEYEFSEPVVAMGAEAEYDFVQMEALPAYERTGAPIVPVRPVRALIPFGRKAMATRVILLDTRELPGTYRLPPAQEPYPLSYPGVIERTEPDPAIYNQSAPWPGIDYEELDTQSKRGYQVFTVNLFPLQYIPTTGKISYVTRMRLEIDLADSVADNVLRPSNKTKSALNRMVDNPDAIGAYTAEDRSVKELGDLTALLPGGPYQYVIITNATLESASGPSNFQALRDAKIARGITATIVTTEWIYSNYSGTRPDGGSDNQTRIRNFLIDAYQNWGTEYVLLGGTDSIIPARMFYVDGMTMPVDMYYGCVDPAACTFDYDVDGYYGESTDGVGGGDVDLYAEIYVGRAPVENATELQNFINKTLTYDLTENDEYLPRIAMLGEYIGFGGVAEYAKDAIEQIRLGGNYDGYFTYGFENHLQSNFIDFNTIDCLPDSPGDCWPLYDKDYDWPKSDLIDLMNGGVHVLNHLGHANYTYGMKLYTSDLASLTNTDYFFAYSQGCDSGGFDIYNCFAEVLTSVEHGAFAAVMNARSGWGRGNSTDGPSQRFDRQFWDAVLDEDMLEIGRANQDSKEDNLWDINGGYIRWCYYELNLFGDPQQQLRFTETRMSNWLGLVPQAGTVMPGDVCDVNVVFDANQPPGAYQGLITIYSNDLYEPETLIPVTMTIKPIDYFTELFDPGVPIDPNDLNCNDMANKTLTFIPDASGSYYRLCSNDAVAFPVDPDGGTIIPLGDDDYEPVILDDGYVDFYGTNYDTFYIGSNGYISFVSGDIRRHETLVDHFDLPRISALFDDLDPSAGGTISWKQLSDRVVVTFENVPEYNSSSSNSFQIEMRFNGKIRITLLDIAAQDGLVGLSDGDGLPPYFVESDLSECDSCIFIGDLNGDIDVDFADFAILAAYWQTQYDEGWADPETVRDEFNAISYSGNDGSEDWSGDWQEIGESDGPSKGRVQVVSAVESNALRLKRQRVAQKRGASRQADISGATDATLTFDWQRDNKYSGYNTTVDVSTDAGATWTTLLSIPAGNDTNLHNESLDISAHIAFDTQIRFIANDKGFGCIYFDNIQIEYDNAAAIDPWCHECDFNQDLEINCEDLLIFAQHWLE